MLIKICGLTRQGDVDAAEKLGAGFCGFIFHPHSPRFISPEAAGELESGSMLRVGVFVTQDAKEILRIMDQARLDLAQLHGMQSIECAKEVGAERVIRVIWPDRYAHRALLYNEVQKYAGSCTYYLFDAGSSGGGSGQRLPWQELYGLKREHPFFLAGGLKAENVGQAIISCDPEGVDFNSGIEDGPGLKNSLKMRAAIEAALNAGSHQEKKS